MTSQQISIKQDVYLKLKNAKRDGESFSDTIDRLLEPQSNIPKILNLYGIAKKEDEFEKQVLNNYADSQNEIRKLINLRFK